MEGRHSGITNSIVASYLETLYGGRSESLEELRKYAESKHVPVILKETENFLLMIMAIKKPQRILEIGTAIGYSASCFAEAFDCHVTTIESKEEMYDAAIVNITNLGFSDRIDVVFGDAAEKLKELDGSQPFDMVFIDASKSHYKEFWDLIIPLTRPGTMIVCDNVLMKGMTASDEFDTRRRYKTSIRKMREFLEYINNLDYAETTVLPVGDGVSVSIINEHEET